jgi:hypothetical protein
VASASLERTARRRQQCPNAACRAWTGLAGGASVGWDSVTSAVGALVEALESVLGWVLSAPAFVIELVFAIPYAGRALRWGWGVVTTAVWGAVGVVDALVGLAGILPEKKLRVSTLVLRDEEGKPVAAVDDVVRELQEAADIFREQANVRLIPSRPFQFATAFSPAPRVTEQWVTVDRSPSPPSILEIVCDDRSFRADLTPKGARVELVSSLRCFYGNFRRLIGYGAPVVVLLVRSVTEPPGVTRRGCSLGPLTDYVSVEGEKPRCIAHELGHACNLWHVSGETNLMNHRCGRRELTWWQVALVRNSRHVTYF